MLTVALVAYIVLGPLAWMGLVLAVMAGRRRMGRLHDDRSPLPMPPPTLTIVIPARNEAAGIRECVSRVIAQDYPDAHFVVVDDRSTDGTAATLDAIADESPQVRVIHVQSLPDGWLGKCHALFVGIHALESDWLLFVDSDVALKPEAARRAIALCESRRYDALSIMPALDARSFWERALLPLLAMAWAAAFQISLTNVDARREHALANGQFFLVRRTWYTRVNGHATVKDRIVEDVALMRVLKRAGARTRLMVGQELARTRMHTNLKQMYNGWARIFAGSSGRSVLPMAITILFLAGTLLVVLSAAITALTTHAPVWIALAAVHAVLIIGFSAWSYRSAGQPARYALLLPLTWPMVMTILAYSIRVCSSGKVDWRGNAVIVNRGSS